MNGPHGHLDRLLELCYARDRRERKRAKAMLYADHVREAIERRRAHDPKCEIIASRFHDLVEETADVFDAITRRVTARTTSKTHLQLLLVTNLGITIHKLWGEDHTQGGRNYSYRALHAYGCFPCRCHYDDTINAMEAVLADAGPPDKVVLRRIVDDYRGVEIVPAGFVRGGKERILNSRPAATPEDLRERAAFRAQQAEERETYLNECAYEAAYERLINARIAAETAGSP